MNKSKDLKIVKFELVQLLCFDLGQRLDLAKVYESLSKQAWVSSSAFGDKRDIKANDILDLFQENETSWSEFYLQEKRFLRVMLKPCRVKIPKDRKRHKMDIICTIYQTGFASLNLWLHYNGKGTSVDDIIACDGAELPLTYILTEELYTELPSPFNKDKLTLNRSDFQDVLRIFFYSKILGRKCNDVKELEAHLRDKSPTEYTYVTVLETTPHYAHPEELIEAYPLEIAGLLYIDQDWRHRKKDDALEELSRDVGFASYERFYIGYYGAVEIHGKLTKKYLEAESKTSKRTYLNELTSHILDSLINVELFNYLYSLIRYLDKEASLYLRKTPSLNELAEKIKAILLDVEEYYDASFESTIAGKEWTKEFKKKMRIEELFRSLETKMNYLRILAQSEFEISSRNQEIRLTRKVTILTIILTLAVLSEVLIGYAQINLASQQPLVFLAFLFPVMLVIIAIVLLLKKG